MDLKKSGNNFLSLFQGHPAAGTMAKNQTFM